MLTPSVIENVTGAVQLVERSRRPACVEACTVFALQFGDADDPNSIVSQMLRAKRSFRLLEEWNTKPSVHYLGSPPKSESHEIERPKTKV